jgi:fluoroquinolone resistance protein
MEKIYFEDQQYNRVDFTENKISLGEYENCEFINCNFSNANLSDIVFAECEFTGCNISSAKLNKTTLRDIRFKDCKLLGLHFDYCNEFLFAVSFDTCILNLSSFYKLKIKKTTFKNCSLHEVDFTETDLTASVFDNCDFAGAIFENTILEKADFITSLNYSINPDINKIKKAKFSASGVLGLLGKYDIEIV